MPDLGARERVARVKVFLARILERLLVGVVARAYEGPALHDPEPDREAELLPPREFFRGDPAVDGQVLLRRLQVLADREDVHAVGREVAQRLLDLLLALAK